MSFEFKNWKKFREQMKEDGISVAKFDFQYYTCVFSMVYGIEQNMFFVGKKGTQTSFAIYLDWFKASVILDNEHYKELVACKDEAYDSSKPYSPKDFLIQLDEELGRRPQLKQVSETEYHKAVSSSIPDEDKIYFKHFMPHTSGERHVTGVNISKVRKILGSAIAEFCKKNNVSVAFTDKPSVKSFEMIKNPRKVLEDENKK